MSLFFFWNLNIFSCRCAFFQGQIEEPVRGLTSLLLHQDMPILVGINERGIYVIDNNDAVSAGQSSQIFSPSIKLLHAWIFAQIFYPL